MSEGNQEIEKIIEDLKNKNDRTRIVAQKKLLEVGKNHVNFLLTLLPNEPVDVQCSICQVLGLAKDARAFEPVVKLFEHENFTLRCYASAALGRMGDQRAIHPLISALSEDMEEDPNVRAEVAMALGRLNNLKAVDPLIDALKNDGDKEVRSKAVLALGMLCDERAVEPLIERIGLDYYVQRSVAIALGQLKDERAIEPLVRLLRDEILGEIAYYSLASINPSFLEMSKDEIMLKYKKPEEEMEETPGSREREFDLDELLASFQDTNPDEENQSN